MDRPQFHLTGVELTIWVYLDSLDASPLPFLLVACKCDLRPDDSDLGAIHERHETYRTSPESPRSQQMCIALVLRAVISMRAGEFFSISIFLSLCPLGNNGSKGLLVSHDPHGSMVPCGSRY